MSDSILLKLFRNPLVIIGMITAVLFQVFFSLIWITGYDHVSDRVDRLKIAIVNEDGTASAEIAAKIASALSFRTETSLTREQAEDALEKRDVRMIVTLPAGFASALAGGGQPASVRYEINQSNPQMATGAMQTAAQRITAALNEQARGTAVSQTLRALRLPQAQAEAVQTSAQTRVTAEMQTVHPVDNFVQTMIPLMVVTASYTGAMLLAMNLNKAAAGLAFSTGKWKLLGARYVLMAFTALIASLIGTAMNTALGALPMASFLPFWMFEFLILLACMIVAQLGLLLLGEMGAWLNIALLSLQMLSSGATIPRDVLPPFYHAVGRFFPAYHAVNGIMDLVIGGSGLARSAGMLALIGAAGIALSLFATALRRAPGRRVEPTSAAV
ncbi:ABC transporter permease [Saccharibacillus sp. CPCC 101409]|uniref:YhgE/Pip domain-containing protein n=1 Tax=Saccharibacillus sp. CPCC 101409 TaxID=3058041 RepID=UPI0026741D4E|nr:ABC transporter permease [Saccharibacillus sp. CPCC 101409]MDO3412195.1 ABC transporter permease [Saccharibacillus sp. CPCC 101409]